MKRRDLSKLIAGTGAALMLPPFRVLATDRKRDPLSGDHLYDHVLHYTQIGEHRTGTTGDLQTADWIHNQFESYGLKAAFHPVSMNLFEVTAGFLELGSSRYRADPEWYPVATPPTGIHAPMRMLAEGEDLAVLKGKIWVAEVQMRRPVVDKAFKEKAVAAAQAGALAVVMVLTYRTKELTGRGAHGAYGQKAWCPIPLVGVAGKHEAVVAAAKRGDLARLVVQGREEQGAEALNVSASIGAGQKQIVITTPQSGMFRCGGERAGGLAVLLGLAEWVGRRKPDARYLFCTNTGHEQDGAGARLLVDEVVPPPGDVAAWLHLGSGVSTWEWRAREDGTYERSVSRSGVRNFGAVPGLTPVLKKAFEPIADLEPQSARFAGELQAYVKAGYPAFGFWGYNAFGHTVADGPEHTAPELLEPVARCLASALEMVERS